METEHKFRCGDTARIEGTDYDIEVAYADYESGSASWFGWPDGDVEIEKLALAKACSDEEHKAAVAMCLDRAGRSEIASRREEYIERLYRPRAYWKKKIRLLAEEQAKLASARSGAEFALRQAEQGPEDV